MTLQLENKSAALATDFGRQWAEKLFGEEAIASLPVYVRGPKKGRPKGYVIWRKALVGGYSRAHGIAFGQGQLVDAWLGAGFFTLRNDALVGDWLGRHQPIGSTMGAYLFQEGRDRAAKEQADRDQTPEDRLDDLGLSPDY